MKYADTITKRFHTAETQSQKTLNAVGNSNMSDYQDPTYMGFMLRIVTSANSVGDLDDLPHGLFTDSPVDNPYSTFNYLLNRGEITRANQILEFETKFRQLVEECPWFFIKVSGLADSWKVEPSKSNWRGKDKKLVIETLESIDMKVAYLLDLYRKSVFDFTWMRYTVPDHMRWFKMDVIVTEVRPMKISTFAYDSLNAAGHYSGGEAHQQNVASNFSQNIPELENKAIDYRGLMDTTSPWTTGTFIKFSYSHCEIDTFAEAPTFLDNVGITPETLAANKITIKTGVIKERNVYGLLGAILEDTTSISSYEKNNFYYPSTNGGGGAMEFGKFQEALPGSDPDIFVYGAITRDLTQDSLNNTSENRSIELQNADGLLPDGPEIVKNEFSSKEKIQGGDVSASLESARLNTTAYPPGTGPSVPVGKAESVPPQTPNQSGASTAAGSTRGNQVGNAVRNLGTAAVTGIRAAAENAVRTQINRALLGNVYGVSPLSLLGSAQSIINNPVAAITNLLRKFSSPQIGEQIAKKVQLTGPEMDLITDIIGQAQFLSAKTPTPSAASATDQKKGTIGKSNLQAFAEAGSKPGNVNLESAPVPPTTLGKSNFS